MLIPTSNWKVLCDNTKNGFLRLLDTLGVCHVQVLKPVSFKQWITKTLFQIRLATVRYFCGKFVKTECLLLRVAILVSNVPSTKGISMKLM